MIITRLLIHSSLLSYQFRHDSPGAVHLEYEPERPFGAQERDAADFEMM
jgi:hypothetical protein